jgi:hypothetical protein
MGVRFTRLTVAGAVNGEENGVKSLFLTLACRFDATPFNGEAAANPI